ncbi:MAG: hypothetical protein WBA22_14575 [Candidatus Methanofastidiosia archaeon]
MNKPKVLQREIFWIPLATLLWLTMIFILHADLDPFMLKNYSPPILGGLIIGFLSGLSPRKAFRVCFYGVFVIAIFLIFLVVLNQFDRILVLSFVIMQMISPCFSGLSGMGGTIVRRIISHEEIEVHLEYWQWALLIGGISIFVDVFFFLNVMTRTYLISYYSWTYLAPFPIVAFFSFLILGLFTGAFYSIHYGKMRSFLGRIQFASHSLFLFFFGLFFVAISEFDRNLLLAPAFSVICAALLFLGAYAGYHLRRRDSFVNAEV